MIENILADSFHAKIDSHLSADLFTLEDGCLECECELGQYT